MRAKLKRKRTKESIPESSFLCPTGCCHQLIVISDRINVTLSLAVFITFRLINQSKSTHTPLWDPHCARYHRSNDRETWMGR